MTKQIPLARLREISRQRPFGRRLPTETSAEDKAVAAEERVEWPISR